MGKDLITYQNIIDTLWHQVIALAWFLFYAIGDMRDTVTIRNDAYILYNASHATLRELWQVTDARHTEARFLHPDEFDQRLAAFFDKALQYPVK